MNYPRKIAKTFDPKILDRLASRLADPDVAATAQQRADDLRAGVVQTSNQGGK